MSDDLQLIHDKLESMDGKLDKALESRQDFRTWRRGHEKLHGIEKGQQEKRLDEVEDLARQNADKISAKLSWQAFIVSLITGAVSALGVWFAAKTGGGNG